MHTVAFTGVQIDYHCHSWDYSRGQESGQEWQLVKLLAQRSLIPLRKRNRIHQVEYNNTKH